MRIVRPATADDAAGIARVHVQAWQESYTGLLPEAVIAEHSVESRTVRWANILARASLPGAGFVCVAALGGEIVGFGSCGAQRKDGFRDCGYTGEFTALYLLRSAQGLGFGRTLMRTLAAALTDRGHLGGSLWVIEGNGRARGFYERIGGVVIGRNEVERPELGAASIGYGWSELSVLASDGASTPSAAAIPNVPGSAP